MTNFPILDGFWMQNDYLAFFTLDFEHNDIYMEVFSLEKNVLSNKFRVKIASRNKADSWHLAVD